MAQALESVRRRLFLTAPSVIALEATTLRQRGTTAASPGWYAVEGHSLESLRGNDP
jgi:hypothetical protein